MRRNVFNRNAFNSRCRQERAAARLDVLTPGSAETFDFAFGVRHIASMARMIGAPTAGSSALTG